MFFSGVFAGDLRKIVFAIISRYTVVFPMNVSVLLRAVINYERTNGDECNIQYFVLHVKSQGKILGGPGSPAPPVSTPMNKTTLTL